MKLSEIGKEIDKAVAAAGEYYSGDGGNPYSAYYVGVKRGEKEIGALTDMVPLRDINAIVCLYTENIPHTSPYGGGFQTRSNGLRTGMLKQDITLRPKQPIEYANYIASNRSYINDGSPDMEIYVCNENSFKKIELYRTDRYAFKSSKLKDKLTRKIIDENCVKAIGFGVDVYDEREEDVHKHCDECWINV